MKCYNCFYTGEEKTFDFIGTERIEGHLLKKYRCPKCKEIHWSEVNCGN